MQQFPQEAKILIDEIVKEIRSVPLSKTIRLSLEKASSYKSRLTRFKTEASTLSGGCENSYRPFCRPLKPRSINCLKSSPKMRLKIQLIRRIQRHSALPSISVQISPQKNRGASRGSRCTKEPVTQQQPNPELLKLRAPPSPALH